MPNLHICIATENNIANDIPISQFLTADDKVILIASGKVCIIGLVGKFEELLKKRGAQTSVIKVKNTDMVNIPKLSEIIKQTLDPMKELFSQLYIYVNGGQKPAAIALDQASREVWGEYHIVYMEFSPIVIVDCFKEKTSATNPADFKNPISLSRLVALYGFRLKDRRPLFTAGSWDAEALSCYSPGSNTRYLEYFKNADKLISAAKAFDKSISDAFLAEKKAPITEKKRFIQIRQNAEIAKGDFFEKCVFWRFKEWLDSQSTIIPLISEIWTNVTTTAEKGKGIAHGEYDLLILMKSGIAVHLESKSGTLLHGAREYQKDDKTLPQTLNIMKALKSKQLTMQESMGNRCMVHIVMHVDNAYKKLPKHESYQFLKDYNFNPLPYTIQGQSEQIRVKIGGIDKVVMAPSFETALERLFDKFQ